MAYEVSVQQTIWTKILVDGSDLKTALDLMEATGPDHFNRKNAESLLRQTGSYSFSNGNKMITIKYVSDFKGQ